MKLIYKPKEFIYFSLITVITIDYMLQCAAINNYQNMFIHNVFLATSLMLAIICIIIQKYTIKSIICLIIFNSVGVLCYFSSGNTGLLTTMIVVTLLPINCLDKTLKLLFRILLIMTVAIVFSSQVGILENTTMEIAKSSYVAFVKTLGFDHANAMAAQMMTLILLYLAIKRDSLNKRTIIFSFILITLVYLISGCRTAFFLGIIVILLLALRKHTRVRKMLFEFLPYAYIIAMIIIFSSLAIYFYLGPNASIVVFVNDTLFNGRVGLAMRSLMVYPITLFGTYMDTSIWEQYSYYALDNGQANILISYGLVGFIVYFCLFQKLLLHIKNEKNYVLGVILLYFIFYSLFEGSMYFFGKNFALLFLGTCPEMNMLSSKNHYRSNDRNLYKLS